MSSNFWCKLLGHKWVYKDFSNAVNEKGSKIGYTKVRKCLRCEKHEYKYAQWLGEDLIRAFHIAGIF